MDGDTEKMFCLKTGKFLLIFSWCQGVLKVLREINSLLQVNCGSLRGTEKCFFLYRKMLIVTVGLGNCIKGGRN